MISIDIPGGFITVGELIEILKHENQDLPVQATFGCYEIEHDFLSKEDIKEDYGTVFDSGKEYKIKVLCIGG